MATASASTNLLPDPEEYSEEVARARALAGRYRLDFIEMEEFRIDQVSRSAFHRVKILPELVALVCGDPPGCAAA